MPKLSAASCTAEFVGTFLLVFTVGCNVMSQNAVWAGVSIACVLMVGIYALGGASGANFNPAVSVALGLSKKMDDGIKQVCVYCAVQVVAGLVASLCYSALFGPFNLGPSRGFAWWQAMVCEVLYTFMLCFVVLNTAASKKIGGGGNQFYGLAIGFVIIAGAYGAGAVSGGCFNPAVAIAIDSSSVFLGGFGGCLLYTLAELAGAALAAAAFMQCRPEERTVSGAVPEEAGMGSKLCCEFLGTYMLVLTVGLNVLASSKAGAFSIAASLMCMIMAVGDVSGGHFNPAVTLAVLLSGRGKIDVGTAGKYVVAQVLGGVLAAFTYALVHKGSTFALGPVGSHGWLEVAVAEIIFTFTLAFVVLCVASTAKVPAPQFIGFIIGSCVTVGGFAIGGVSGGSLNPAVSIGIAAANVMNGGFFFKALIYSALEFIGAVVAAGVFASSYPSEYEKTQ